MQQQGTVYEFKGNESWVILSPIEQSIRRKIESVGTPLKDWNISIYRGVLTGCNEAFIIDTEKRRDILQHTADYRSDVPYDFSNPDSPLPSTYDLQGEFSRTVALIRPILRGRDIKRYNYEWANQWLIATFPSRHYNIDEYPAVRMYLESYGNGHGREILEQTGTTHFVDGKSIKSRKKTGNKWFETQDSISYWEDFSQPKIIWKRIGSLLRFSYDKNSILGLDSTCFAIGDRVPYLCCLLNSKMGNYLLKDAPKTGTGDLIISVQAIEPVMAAYSDEVATSLVELLEKNISKHNQELENKMDDIIFSLYGLTDEEKLFVSKTIDLFR